MQIKCFVSVTQQVIPFIFPDHHGFVIGDFLFINKYSLGE